MDYIVGSIKLAKRLTIGVIGFTVMAVGIALIFLPGPAFVVIPLGLGILATEFVWAKRFLRKTRSRMLELRDLGGFKHESKETKALAANKTPNHD